MSYEIPVVFHNGSNHDYHFMIKKLPNKFKGQFECIGENTEKYKTFSVPIVYKEGNKNIITISYKVKFIYSARFMSSSLSNLVNNLAKGIHKIKYKCLFRNKDYSNKLNEEIKKRFKKTFTFSDNNINPFEYMND